MKKLYYFFALLATSMLLYSYSPTSEGGKTGSNGAPGESTCTSCHGGAANGTATLTSDIPLAGFVPGATYNMVFTVSQAGQPLFGMGLESLSATNTQAGTLVAGTGTQVLVKTLKQNLIHTLGGGASADSKAFSFKWTAPAVAAGNVTFYYAGLAANGDGVENNMDNTYVGNKVFSPQAVAAPTVLTPNCPTDATVATAAGATTAVATYTAPTGTSTCTTGTVTATKTSGLASGSAFPIGSTPISYTIADGCGNTKTCSFNVIVTATAAPTVLTPNCPTDVTVATAAGATTAVATYTAPTGTSTCTTGTVTATKTSGLASGSAFPIGSTPISYTIADGCGNTKTCSFNVIVKAGQAPVITINCPANVNVTAAAGATTAVATYTAPVGTSTCATGTATTTLTSGLASGSAFPIGTNVVCYTVTDGCGGTQKCCFNIVVTGTALPTVLTVNCPLDMTLTAAAGATTAVANFTAPTATSTCTLGTVTIVKTSVLASGAAFPIGSMPISYTITDGCGNSKTCTFNVIVKAAQPTPVLTVNCPADITLTAAAGANSAIAIFKAPTATSTCTLGTVTIVKTSVLASGAAFTIGTTDVCYKITDGCGNTKECCFKVKVVGAGTGTGTETPCSKIEFEAEEGMIKITNLPKTEGYSVGIKLTNASNNVIMLQCTNCAVNRGNVKIKNLKRDGVYTVLIEVKQNGVLVCKRTETLAMHEGISNGSSNQSLSSTAVNPDETVLFAEPLGIYATNTFRVSPNPAMDEVEVEVKQFKGRAVTILIANKFGQVVKTQQVIEASDASVRVSLENIQDGFYTITLLTKGESKANKLVVQKY
jgi:HYR domain/Secretion system C-terminal sorting domain